MRLSILFSLAILHFTLYEKTVFLTCKVLIMITLEHTANLFLYL
ncbi:hypothetical protein CLCAR_1485 [Clostridium carboxidivorans P7]|nr:hypothetical protein CLCAR_1485 [Clostridium carboxidivorans P7]